jgi:hypothetical protein
MPKIIRHDGIQRPHIAWAVPIFVAIIVAWLLGVIASTPKGALRVFSVAQAELAGPVTRGAEPAPGMKQAVRYEAIIENWKRYRSTQAGDPIM